MYCSPSCITNSEPQRTDGNQKTINDEFDQLAHLELRQESVLAQEQVAALMGVVYPRATSGNTALIPNH